jgi:hypothetical protein
VLRCNAPKGRVAALTSVYPKQENQRTNLPLIAEQRTRTIGKRSACYRPLRLAISVGSQSIIIIRGSILKTLPVGTNALVDLEAGASSREPFGWQMIVEVSGTPADEKHLAWCSVSRVKDVAGGPPMNCVTVAITPSMTLLRGGCFISASSRFDTGIIDAMSESNDSAAGASCWHRD